MPEIKGISEELPPEPPKELLYFHSFPARWLNFEKMKKAVLCGNPEKIPAIGLDGPGNDRHPG